MEDFDENDEMAAMMGFSAFGGTKKRKYDQANSPKAQDEYSASGANSTELGVRTKVSSDEQKNREENVGVASSTQQTAKPSPPGTGLASFLARGQGLPERPPTAAQQPQEDSSHVDPSASEALSFGGPSVSRAELNALRFGVKDENGDTAYFLPSFVENPWERLITNRT